MLLQAREVDLPLGRLQLHLVQQVVDRLVAVRRHPHPLVRIEQTQNQLGPGVGLSRTGWALNEQIAVAEPENYACRLVQVGRTDLQRPARLIRPGLVGV